MELNQKNIKRLLYVLTFAIVLYWGVQNIADVAGAAAWLWKVLSPFVTGLCVAFVLNVPMSAFERMFRKPRKWLKGKPLSNGWDNLVRPVSLLLSVVLILGVIVFVLTMVIPQIGVTIALLADEVVRFIPKVQGFVTWLQAQLSDYPQYQQLLSRVVPDWNQMFGQVVDFLKNFSVEAIAGSIGAASSIFSGVFDTFLMIVFSIYAVMQKEKLAVQGRRFLYAFLPERAADEVLRVASLSYKTFFTYVTVQVTEAAILASLCFIGMTIFRFPYALIISVMMFVFALIPIIGAIISCVVGAFFILMESPVQAMWFIVFILVLQQLEGNLIYPRVVSSSFGLPPMWVLIAVTLGSSLFGMIGLLVGVPTTCVVYTLLRERMHAQLKRKQIAKEKLEPHK